MINQLTDSTQLVSSVFTNFQDFQTLGGGFLPFFHSSILYDSLRNHNFKKLTNKTILSYENKNHNNPYRCRKPTK